MLAEVEVLQPGLYTSIQDTGRFDFMRYGVPVSGPMDTFSAGMANLLLNNAKNAAVLEITQMGPKLRFSKETVISISGADFSPKLNENRIENNHPVMVSRGDVLQFGKRNSGCRAYLAIKNGFQTKEVLKSRSWYEGITPFARLEKGMKLAYFPQALGGVEKYAAIKEGEHLAATAIEALPGPEFEFLTKADKEYLFNKAFSLGQNSDRMGFQLLELFQNKLESILTAPVMPGTVQLTPSGRMIVLMKDGQTTGGYPRILQLTEKGINSIAQKIPGEKFHFVLKKEVLS